MASGGGELPEGPEELGLYIEDTGKGGSQSRVSGTFFKAVVQAFLIFGAETWVMTPCIGQSLGGFITGSRNESGGVNQSGKWIIVGNICR